MLKNIYINKKRIAVSALVSTLEEALSWVNDSIVPRGHCITSVIVDGKPRQNYELSSEKLLKTTELKIQIDSPFELAIQSLDALSNLASLIIPELKSASVRCWKNDRFNKPVSLKIVIEDCQLIADILDNLVLIFDDLNIDSLFVQELSKKIKAEIHISELAISNSDWKSLAKIFLNRVEPLIKLISAKMNEAHVKYLKTK